MGWGDLLVFMYFMLFLRLKMTLNLVTTFLKLVLFFSEHPDLSSSFHSSLYRPLSFNLPDRTGRQGIADFEKNVL